MAFMKTNCTLFCYQGVSWGLLCPDILPLGYVPVCCVCRFDSLLTETHDWDC